MWVGGVNRRRINAYNLITKAYESTKSFDTGSEAAPFGIWSDGVTMWVVDGGRNTRLSAFTLATGAYDSGMNFALHASNDAPAGIWSDGTTMWVTGSPTSLSGKIYAYRMDTQARDDGKDFNTLTAAGNFSPQGLWSDGVTMWVVDGSLAKIFAYNLITKAYESTKDFELVAQNDDTRGVWGWRAYYMGGGLRRPPALRL